MRMRSVAVTALTVVALGLSGCADGRTPSSDGSPGAGGPRPADTLPAPTGIVEPSFGPPASGDFTDADVAFAQQLVQLDTLLVQLSEHTVDATRDGRVRTLAATLRATSQPRALTASGWLQGWGEDVPGRPVIPADEEAPTQTDTPMPGPTPSGDLADKEGGEGVDADKRPGITRTSSPEPTAPGLLDDAAVERVAKAEGDAVDPLYLDAVETLADGLARIAATEQVNGANLQAKALAGQIAAQTEQLTTDLAAARRPSSP